jgi:hypothetical protein
MKIAKQKGDLVRFQWDFCDVVLAADSNPDLIYRDYHRAIYGCLGDRPTVGPHPAAELSESVLKSDQAFCDAAKKRSEERAAEWARKEQDRYGKLRSMLESCRPLDIWDGKFFEKIKAKSAYKDIVEFVSNWGRLMQFRIEAGETVSQCAMETSITADNGNSGASFGVAVGVLGKCWIYGDALLTWHENRMK